MSRRVLHKRLDQWLVELHLAPSKTKAKDLILSGAVICGEKKLTKPGAVYAQEEIQGVQVIDTQILKYVSRAGLKLEGAVKHSRLTIAGKKILDVGSSTGGFSDFLLQNDASLVVGFDVGQDQIHPSLLKNSRFKNFAGVHFNQADEQPELKEYLAQKFDLIVADVSFISVTKLLPFARNWLAAEGQLLFLVKPQFELSPDKLNKKGIVKKAEYYQEVEHKLRTQAAS
ncbi:MAG: methyltransferase domain-containing protein, partial [Bdellovibrionales bacterium]|nr:methyltransferase domain-containing protein [Bdellovibrionales bacterium]